VGAELTQRTHRRFPVSEVIRLGDVETLQMICLELAVGSFEELTEGAEGRPIDGGSFFSFLYGKM
jgi:hypothetical protein